MKSFEINALGLENLSENEVRMTNGGSVLVAILVAAVVAAVALIATGHDWENDPNGNGFHVSF